MKLKHIFLTFSFALMLIACNDWLDVKPKTLTDEDDLFSRPDGFKEQLTGVYIQMATPELYAKTLMYDVLDAYAAMRIPDRSKTNMYVFKSTDLHSTAIFDGMYRALANVNVLLSALKTNGPVLEPSLKDIIEGEAYGLRAFLYFDLLRMFGPIMSQSPSKLSVPYRTEVSSAPKEPLPANVLTDSILVNLKKAEQLLDKDPMNISFPQAVNDAPRGFLEHRNNRMNKFAVKALMARVYLYKGDKSNAAKYAQAVVEAKNQDGTPLFRLIEDNSVDRIFSRELIFSLNCSFENDGSNFEKQIEGDYTLQLKSSGDHTEFIIEHLLREKIFDTAQDGLNDIRVADGRGFEMQGNYANLLKFRQKGLFSYAVKSTVPLIRLPEMYYILAECTENLSQSAQHISKVRVARGLNPTPPFNNAEERDKFLDKEYRKEFYGEGQYWYFLKRRFARTWVTYPFTYPMTEENYIFKLPVNEIQYR